MPKLSNEPAKYPRINDQIRKRFRGNVILNGKEVFKEGLNQEELAELLGMNKKDRYKLSYYEQGREECPLELLKKMADVLDCSIDSLLDMPFKYTWHHQGNSLQTAMFKTVDREVYEMDFDKKGIIDIGYKFKDNPTTIRAFILDTNNETLGARKGDLVIVDTDVKKYINSNTSSRYLALVRIDAFLKKNTHSASTAYYFSEVGAATDMAGNVKKRSFFFRTPTKQLVIAGCQYAQRSIDAIVVQIEKFFM